MAIFSIKRSAAVFGMAVVLSVTMHGQSVQGTEARPGKLVGTVTDVNDDPVPDATVVRHGK
jgi:hypothetical protein